MSISSHFNTNNAINQKGPLPYFVAINDSGSLPVTGDGTEYITQWPVKQFDSCESFDVATGLYTIPETGLWSISTIIALNNLLVDHDEYTMILYSEGYGDLTLFSCNPGAMARPTVDDLILTTSANFLYLFYEGDILSIKIVVSGGTKTVTADSGTMSVFSGFLVEDIRL